MSGGEYRHDFTSTLNVAARLHPSRFVQRPAICLFPETSSLEAASRPPRSCSAEGGRWLNVSARPRERIYRRHSMSDKAPAV